MRQMAFLQQPRKMLQCNLAVRRSTMHRTIAIAGLLSVLSLATLPAAPAFAISAKQKMATCKFGADNEKLAGQKRAEFLKRCMSDENDPRGPAVGIPGGKPPPKS
jgi:hypothetical protein